MRKNLLTEVLEKLGTDVTFQSLFSKNRRLAVDNLSNELNGSGYEVQCTGQDLNAIATLDLNSFSNGNKSRGSFFFGAPFGI